MCLGNVPEWKESGIENSYGLLCIMAKGCDHEIVSALETHSKGHSMDNRH